ncbi:MAG TPA: hypothetical protein PLJ27_25260 [Polyangiaceae bacterium]|jgi:hypothetical protein|nr:MAG: hypothetical protein BWY17_03398 [Deltaproteobacteria bacterium ADurb.Bin207]HNZ24908.1 hypothetical protein [Polyangiaceae bacterium]HOE50503.1 hypothetical protein [Polyangiaceae bacterium]HOH03049.1 hypothetical protein [Polyangiaceae bacterium]HOR37312.1 hypothetical protein [Polyangiaceae bacterium]
MRFVVADGVGGVGLLALMLAMVGCGTGSAGQSSGGEAAGGAGGSSTADGGSSGSTADGGGGDSGVGGDSGPLGPGGDGPCGWTPGERPTAEIPRIPAT